jgi:hypothetical protein
MSALKPWAAACYEILTGSDWYYGRISIRYPLSANDRSRLSFITGGVREYQFRGKRPLLADLSGGISIVDSVGVVDVRFESSSIRGAIRQRYFLCRCERGAGNGSAGQHHRRIRLNERRAESIRARVIVLVDLSFSLPHSGPFWSRWHIPLFQ